MLLVLTNHGDSREMSGSKKHPSADITTLME